MYPILFELPEWLPILGGEAITSFGVFMLFAFLMLLVFFVTMMMVMSFPHTPLSDRKSFIN